MDDVLKTLEKLPPMCASTDLTTGDTILLKRGCIGYWPGIGIDVEAFNERHGVTAAQRIAMEIGSHFGFDVPGANPDKHAA
jgi:hypothetical protein